MIVAYLRTFYRGNLKVLKRNHQNVAFRETAQQTRVHQTKYGSIREKIEPLLQTATAKQKEEQQRTVTTTSLRRNPLYVFLYVFASKFVLFELIPYLTVLICNIIILVKIKRSKNFRRTNRKEQRKRGRTWNMRN